MHRHRRFDRFDLKTKKYVTSCGGVREGLTGLASKPGETGLIGLASKLETGLTSLDLKTGGRTWCGQGPGGGHLASLRSLRRGEMKS